MLKLQLLLASLMSQIRLKECDEMSQERKKRLFLQVLTHVPFCFVTGANSGVALSCRISWIA